MLDILTFNGQSFADFGTFWDGSQLFGTPEKEVEFFEVPGRNGDLSITKDRFKNKNVSINCFIRQDFVKNYSNLMNYLLSQEGYGRLENTKEPEIYREAQFVADLEPKTGAFLHYGTFTLTFNCKPQKWLKTGEKAIEITSSKTIINPTQFIAKPLIEVTGTGRIVVNNSVLDLAQNTSTTFIDCDIQDAYEGTINRNSDLTITNGFPRLNSGENTISVTGCSIKLYPRWWKL